MSLNEKDFISTLTRILEQEYKNNYNNSLGKISLDKDFELILSSISICNIFIEYTGIFTRTEWNTYRAVLHLQVPLDKKDVYEKYKNVILNIASSLFGKQDDYYLTDLSIDILIEKYEVIDFSSITLNSVIKKAIEDAEEFMAKGKYSSAIDRVHTGFHGYLRERLKRYDVEFNEGETLTQLLSKLYNHLDKLEENEINKQILTCLRSSSAVINSLNDIRNRHSLSHPNEEIISDKEALLVINLTKNIADYIENRV